MSKVYFSKDLGKVLEKLDLSKLGKRVGIKLHFGEKGNVTYLKPEIAKKVYEYIKDKKKDLEKIALVECNVLYRGERMTRTSHIALAKEHGFGFADIDILDGEYGEETLTLKVEGGIINEAKVGKGLERYDSLVVLTHFKGHVMAGYGGAFKNLGMGLGSRAGKLHMHANVSPKISKSQCTGCGTCIRNCGSDAIVMKNNKAEIINDKCTGCAMCIAVCPVGAVKIPWLSSTSSLLQKKIVDYSKAIIEYLNNRLVYINALVNITKDCDCMGKKQKPIVEDIGFLVSNDPVAIDKASLDLVNKATHHLFSMINVANKNLPTKYAESLSLGSSEYELINLDS